MAGDRSADSGRRGSTRRRFLLGGAVAGIGAATAIGADHVLNRRPAEGEPAAPLNGEETVPFHGVHQAGVATPAQAHAVLVALDLRDSTDADALRRMMRILSDDAARLTQGVPALADSEPELAVTPARLTVTFGFGPGLVDRAGGTRPEWLRALPDFGVDRLRPEFSDGDLLIQVAADDPMTVAHAVRMLLKDTRGFASVRWTQRGFHHAHGSVRPGTTMRNLFGQIDGTTNPQPGTEEFERLVWNTEGWLAGGTGMVVRRIHMDLEGWDRLDRPGREQSVGRYLSNGAPLTGTDEFDEPDFEATTPIGFPVIPEFSHVRRARSDDPNEKIFRRAYNYDDPPSGSEISNSGLLFVSFQADVDRQFVPLQRRLDELDLLNEWTVPIGSAVFAIPPGCAEDGYVGDTLLG
ncbi:peroxidase [Actinoalloteichus sp. AHMU CJ021]|uniref:Dye decolorizing peroxidase n=1 Tax=Actinoalloteichus caeruleus DSM 43889 TaxID=1120930 RepID=A0ABT1JLR8_ACTCY|nr:Dyp-type peroxidase [Actinoalloteichus caeruleus]AUS78902.1 peroxidase [Actinoalloteichus sp. AHMU CJ021]MCP2333106.1 dye decolorizing peroxidase [Actinoalloteichus caeruleus DSM 43889]